MNNKIVATIAVIALLVGGIALFRGPSTQVIKETIKEIGAMPGNEIQGPEFVVGGISRFSTSKGLAKATTTPCVITAPSATSTLESAGIRFASSSISASIVTIAKAAKNTYATTTLINRVNVAAGIQGTIMASTTINTDVGGTGVDPLLVFAPFANLVISMEGADSTFSPSGVCHATFESYAR